MTFLIRIIISLIIYAIIGGVTYLCIAFIHSTYDITSWNEDMRAAFITLLLFMGSVLTLFFNLATDDKEIKSWFRIY